MTPAAPTASPSARLLSLDVYRGVLIVGMNPLLLFLLGSLSARWVATQLQIHLPGFLFTSPWSLVVEPTLVAALFWLLVWWMHRRKIHI
jgi:hypothetical protein